MVAKTDSAEQYANCKKADPDERAPIVIPMNFKHKVKFRTTPHTLLWGILESVCFSDIFFYIELYFITCIILWIKPLKSINKPLRLQEIAPFFKKNSGA